MSTNTQNPMPQPPTPLRIQKIELSDFRAFPGPLPTCIELKGKNLLVYGENGSGKSSLFNALRDFFSLEPRRKLRDHQNVFTKCAIGACRVDVSFNDKLRAAEWFHATRWQKDASPIDPKLAAEMHPATRIGNADARVSKAALRSACIDYRSLLDTNYLHGDQHPDLFMIAVEHLLADYPVTIPGGTTKTIGELWNDVQHSKPTRHTGNQLKLAQDACDLFNAGMLAAIRALEPHIEKLLEMLTGDALGVIPFENDKVYYNNAHYRRDRAFSGYSLRLPIVFHSHQPERPQHFLNEARLSALGLAIYLAGRLACTPASADDSLKLLVLDDVLIGLDHSNRLPLLKVLQEHFSDWQIVLMTHDYVWYEMARNHLPIDNGWKCVEFYDCMDVTRGIPTPFLRAVGECPIKACLDQAWQFLNDNHLPAAANYARRALEMTVASFCEKRGVPLPFLPFPKSPKVETFLKWIKKWEKQNPSNSADVLTAVTEIERCRSVVLNPYSHAQPVNIPRTEVEDALKAVEKLMNLRKSPQPSTVP